MKNDVMPSRVQMEPEVLERLVTEVKETLAGYAPAPGTRKNVFGVVDLWNIQRQGKSASSLRKWA